MKPPAFEYFRAGSLDEALALLAQHPGAKPLAGGQSLIPAMNFRLAAPGVLVDLSRVAGLGDITGTPAGGLRIGAMARHSEVETSALVRERAPLLAEAMPWVAHPQIRNRGTLGGSLAHADPAAELPAVMVALRAGFELRSGRGTRTLPAEEFFTGLFATALESSELLTAIELPPRSARTGYAFAEFARRHGDYALAGVASTLTLDAGGTCVEARAVLFSVGDVPVLAARVAAALEGVKPNPDSIAVAAQAVQQDIDPPGDIHASSAYRLRLATVLVRRSLIRAFERAQS